jgi:hypothetical protein
MCTNPYRYADGRHWQNFASAGVAVDDYFVGLYRYYKNILYLSMLTIKLALLIVTLSFVTVLYIYI